MASGSDRKPELCLYRSEIDTVGGEWNLQREIKSYCNYTLVVELLSSVVSRSATFTRDVPDNSSRR